VKPESLAIQQQGLNGSWNGCVASQRLPSRKRGASDTSDKNWAGVRNFDSHWLPDYWIKSKLLRSSQG